MCIFSDTWVRHVKVAVAVKLLVFAFLPKPNYCNLIQIIQILGLMALLFLLI